MTPDEQDKAFRGKRLQIVSARTALLRDTNAEIQRLLKTALTQIQSTLAAQPTDYQRWYLPQLAAEIKRVLAQFGDSAAGTLSTASSKAWQLGQDLVEKPLDAAAVRVTGTLPLLDTRQLQAMRAFMTDRIKNVGAAAADRINAQLGLVVIGAQSPSDAIGQVRTVLGEESRARATTIVRTELSRVYAVAAFQRLQQTAARVPGMQKQWRKSGKLHPRFYHALADGQVRDIDKPFDFRNGAHLMFPHDPAAPAGEVINCGCIMLPFKSDWSVSQPGRAPGELDEGVPVNQVLGNAA